MQYEIKFAYSICEAVSLAVRRIKLKKHFRRSVFFWLGRLDLNQRMTESKSVVLPLDDAPIYDC